ncbi:MAG: DNA-binding protein [Clostridiales bacterium]|nr:DNA-binding protein [Clostridiales bacterium]
MNGAVLGFDTSNYKTSVAVYHKDSENYSNGRLLSVEKGQRGLRQNDALFLHVKSLHEITESVFEKYKGFSAIGASYAPRRVINSYMPCFLAGLSAGEMISQALHVPFFTFSHQEGHLAAAALSAEREDLLNAEFLAWHLSGGTSELLYVKSDSDHFFDVSVIGGTSDLAAGQLLDRAGVSLGLLFPSGAELDSMSNNASLKTSMRPKADGLYFSLSGIENKVTELIAKNTPASEIAYFTIKTVSNAVMNATERAIKQYRLPILCSGGVMANTIIRSELSQFGTIFASPEYSGDNALGIAYLAAKKLG